MCAFLSALKPYVSLPLNDPYVSGRPLTVISLTISVPIPTIFCFVTTSELIVAWYTEVESAEPNTFTTSSSNLSASSFFCASREIIQTHVPKRPASLSATL